MISLSRQADRRWQQLRKLTEVSRALTYALSLQEVLDLTVRRAGELLEATKVVLMLVNDEGLLSVRASQGLDRDTCERFREPLHETLITRLHGLLGNAPQEHFLGVPLVVGGQVTGLLAVARPQAVEDRDDEEWLLSALADQAAVALEKTRLGETAEFRERLIGIVSHDLRNPVAAVLLAVELLRQQPLDRQALAIVKRLHSSASRAGRLIEELLDCTQARLGGGIPINRRPANLHVIVKQVTDELEVTYPGRPIEVTHRGSGDGDWDPERLAQVVGNLLTNAINYGARQAVIQVHTQEDDAWACLTVSNQGPPIPPERLPFVFEPMQRATSELTAAGRSVGLGLYIVKHLIDAHGGQVSVQSSAATGTQFTVRLPRHRGAVQH